MNRRTLLLVLVVALASFEAGGAFDRWLHRPLIFEGGTVSFSATNTADAPPALGCFSDKPESCAPLPSRPIVKPHAHGPLKPLGQPDPKDRAHKRHYDWSGADQCRQFKFFGTNVCQKET